MEQPVRQTASEQLSYAEVLHWSILLGFIVLVVTFLAYVLGWLPSYVPLERLPQLWGLSAAEYLKATGIPTGWSSLALPSCPAVPLPASSRSCRPMSKPKTLPISRSAFWKSRCWCYRPRVS
jgi:hypothetical protein